ncbi:hypothetical protein KQX54_008086 [Cotesia glomerata]|uniref:Uncharacterized protein n=1 Tax=Cotesia glomerata TaxID=32391 RepID=A0AAV7IGP3_COTGL|nr:hypothetical protein KQX54_008086 [Cotesia glomerata]
MEAARGVSEQAYNKGIAGGHTQLITIVRLILASSQRFRGIFNPENSKLCRTRRDQPFTTPLENYDALGVRIWCLSQIPSCVGDALYSKDVSRALRPETSKFKERVLRSRDREKKVKLASADDRVRISICVLFLRPSFFQTSGIELMNDPNRVFSTSLRATS